MPDPDQLNDFLEPLGSAGSPARNPSLRQALGWEEPLYEEVKDEPVAKATNNGTPKDKSLESCIWDGTCSIRGAKDGQKDNNSIQPLSFTKRSALSIY